jgi:DNA primase
MKRFSEAHREELLLKSQNCLLTKEGAPGMEYLTEHRKLDLETIQSFGLGYIPSNVKHQLAGRIVIPLYDPSGNLIVLASRMINDEPSDLPVYWHESYEKSYYLYGCNLAKNWMRKWNVAVLCEGQFDVMQMHKNGIRNTVGLCSNKFSDIQLSVILRYCDEIVVLLDCDENEAGQLASEKIISHLVPRGYKIISAEIIKGYDPDDFLKEFGDRDLKKIINNKVKELRYNAEN